MTYRLLRTPPAFLAPLALSVLLAACNSSDKAGAESEPNDSRATATAIDVDKTYKGELSERGEEEYEDEDWYAFKAESGRAYSIATLSEKDSTDTYIELYSYFGGTLMLIDENDDYDSNEGSVSGTNAGLDWGAIVPGTYYVKVTGYSGATGAYRVRVEDAGDLNTER